MAGVFSTRMFAASGSCEFGVHGFRPAAGPLLVCRYRVNVSSRRRGITACSRFHAGILPHVTGSNCGYVRVVNVRRRPCCNSFNCRISDFFTPSSHFNAPGRLGRLVSRTRRVNVTIVVSVMRSRTIGGRARNLNHFSNAPCRCFRNNSHHRRPT